MQGANMRVSDLISKEEIVTWKPGSVVTIKAPCDSGKSYFVKNSLYQYAKEHDKKILMLINREATVAQFQMELEREHKTDTIRVSTYQKIEHANLRGWSLSLIGFDFIVCDEAHYFLDDAVFNHATDVSFDEIMQQEQAIKILMTASMDNLHEYITSLYTCETVDYTLPSKNNHIEALTFFLQNDTIPEIAKQIIQSGEKGLIFIDDIARAYKLHQQFKGSSIFCCSKSQPKYKHVNDELIQSILQKERFEAPLLITTSSLSTGINFIDPKLKHIVIDVNDPDTIIQAAGRKRVKSEDENIRLYIRGVNNNSLGGKEQITKKALKMATFFLEHSLEEFMREYPRMQDKSGIIYEELHGENLIKKVNRLMFQKKQNDIATYRKMQELGPYGFCRYIARVFGFYDSETDTYSHKMLFEDYSLLTYLSNMVGQVMLNRTDRKELIARINIKSNGRLLRSRETLNAALAERKIPYHIE